MFGRNLAIDASGRSSCCHVFFFCPPLGRSAARNNSLLATARPRLSGMSSPNLPKTAPLAGSSAVELPNSCGRPTGASVEPLGGAVGLLVRPVDGMPASDGPGYSRRLAATGASQAARDGGRPRKGCQSAKGGSKATNTLETTLKDVGPDSLRGKKSTSIRRRDISKALEIVLKTTHGIGIY
ncbi:hypothetical protein GGI43DRAFT_370050 [Trichoderma evansii]